MARATTNFALLTALCLLGMIPAERAHALPDQYLGDASIYAGVPQSVGRPNVLFIIDNSRSTLQSASNAKFVPGNMYPPNPALDNQGDPACPDTTGAADGSGYTDNAGKGCFKPTVIYAQDNQGQFSKRVADAGVNVILATLCDGTPSEPLTDPVRTLLRNFGTYSGAGGAPFPNLDITTGACVTASNGEVYALGNYLNYLLDTEGDTVVTTPPDDGGGETVCTTTPADVVSKETCPKAKFDKNGDCEEPATFYYTCVADHTSASTDVQMGAPPAKKTLELINPQWSNYMTSPPAGSTPVPWAAGVSYEREKEICTTGGGEPVVVPPTTVTAPQREIIYEALAGVIHYASTAVNFGAMVYGGNNSGGLLVAPMADLSESIIGREVQDDGTVTVVVPDCSTTAGSQLAYCEFLAAIPGMRSDPSDPGPFTTCADFNGADCVSSNTGRPQAESVFDAGYYFGADYTSVTNTTKLLESDPVFNECDLNHIILITNGFSNGDDSPKLDVIGDADGDNYPDENDYGLGSHWLDDVARYLQANHDVTTHTVLAFQSDDDLVRNAAMDGGGRYYQASNRRELERALLDLLGSIMNDKSTSFVAPVVPASTTNRTISSNRVYLGLFRPQSTGPWYGNVKKYGLTSDSRLAEPPETTDEINGDPATYPDGSFITDSVSFWSLQGGVIPSALGDINPNATDANVRKGDGAEVAAGGIGGVLLKRVQALSTAIKTGGSTSGLPRDIFTFIGGVKQQIAPDNAAIDPALLGLPDDTLDWWLTGATPDASDISALTIDQSQLLYRRNNLIRFVRGFDALNVQVGETIWDPRKWVMGDILHSRPVVFNYTKYTAAEESVCDENSSVIFVGANDGMLHAFRDCDGKEIWGFVPDDVLANLKYLPGNKHTTFVDSPPAILFYDREEDGEVTTGDRVIIVFGLRRGGGKNTLGTGGRGAYYALDITDINNPLFLWKLDLADYPQLAETWGIPVIKPIKVQGADADAPSEDIRYVAFIGAGYDQNEDLRFGNTQAYPDGTGLATNLNQASEGGSVDGLDTQDPPQTLIETSPGSDVDGFNMRGRGVAAIQVGYMTPTGTGEDRRYNLQYTPAQNAAIGTLIWNYSPDSMSHSVATDIRTLDLNGNGGYIDTVYAGDLGGNLWRFDTTNRDPGSCTGANLDNCNWTGEIIFSSNSTYSNSAGRKFFYPPAVAKDNNTTWVCFNTGDREHPLNLAVVDRLYCIKDFRDVNIAGSGQTTADAIDESDLVDVTENLLQASTTSSTMVTEILNQLRSSPTRLLEDGSYKYGWYIRLDGRDRTLSGELGEKALAEPVIFNGEVFFSTYQIKTGERANCEAGNLGISRLYRLALETGEAAYNYDLNNDTLNDADLSSPEDPQTGNDRASGGENIAKRRTDRVKTLGEGIPSGIVQVVDAAGNVNLLISSSDKVEGIGGANPTSTFPVYWIQR